MKRPKIARIFMLLFVAAVLADVPPRGCQKSSVDGATPVVSAQVVGAPPLVSTLVTAE